MSILPRPLSPEAARLKNPLSLAFVGDTVWDLLVRQRLLLSQAHAVIQPVHQLLCGGHKPCWFKSNRPCGTKLRGRALKAMAGNGGKRGPASTTAIGG